MKSKKLDQLRRCNNSLSNTAWFNYQMFLEKLLRSVDHPVAKDLLSCLIHKDFDGLLRIADCISSTEYETAAEHRLCNQLSAVIRKYPFPKGTVTTDPEGLATEKFLASEHSCKRVNQRFRAYVSVRSPHEYALNQARSWISYVLGDLKLKEVWDYCDFGPGASIGVHGDATNPARKLLAKDWTVTPSAFYYCYAALIQDVHVRELLTKQPDSLYYSYDNELFMSFLREKATMIDHNKIVFVPKTARVHRTIAVEPLLNGYVQKGIDVFMRKRLKRVGIDLTDQSRNQDLARQGSLDQRLDPYVTIDLSAASDSCSIELCRYMLPLEWFQFLDSTRSHRYVLNGMHHTYHKFTTMGNGFCFPLETLLFASLCHVAYQECSLHPDFSVYGDDIIVRQSVATRVLQLLKICGFRANLDKTFLSGPFRESCGADWFQGEDVRPLSLDYCFDSVQNIVKFYNLSKSKGTWECIFNEVREFLVELIPPCLRLCRPYKGNVDGALEVPWDVFINSPFSRFELNTHSWSWSEFLSSALYDKSITQTVRYEVALIRGALAGGISPNPFTLRRKTSTKIRRVNHHGIFPQPDLLGSYVELFHWWESNSLSPVFQWVRARR